MMLKITIIFLYYFQTFAIYHGGVQQITLSATTNTNAMIAVTSDARVMAIIYSPTLLKMYVQQNGLYTNLASATTTNSFKIVSISDDGTLIYVGLGNGTFKMYIYDLNTNLIENFTSPTTLPSAIVALDCIQNGTIVVYGCSTVSSNLIIAKWIDNTTGFIQLQSIPLTPGYFLKGVSLINQGNTLVYWCSSLIPVAFDWGSSSYILNSTKFAGLPLGNQQNLVLTDSIVLDVQALAVYGCYYTPTQNKVFINISIPSGMGLFLTATISYDQSLFIYAVSGVLYLQAHTQNGYQEIRTINSSMPNSNFYLFQTSLNASYIYQSPHQSNILYIYFVCIPNCQVCSTRVTCDLCKFNFLLSSDQKSCLCQGNYSLTSDMSSCVDCSLSNCAICSTIGLCQTCSQGFILKLDNTCVCPSYKYLDINSSLCIFCQVDYCLSCSSDDICNKCNQGFDSPSILNNYTCDCPYPKIINSISSKCLSCNVLYCVKCISDDFCETCYTGFTLFNGTCLCDSPNNTISSSYTSCVSCNINNCYKCDYTDTCQACLDGFIMLNNGQCICSSNQGKTLNLNGSQCYFCLIQYCLRCDANNVCAQCKNGFTLNINESTCVCESGFTISSTSDCVLCNISFCQKCDFDNQCSMCNNGFSIINSSCECMIGRTIDANNDTCVVCIVPNCIRCDINNICAQCDINFELNLIAGTCGCPYQYTISTINQTCVSCSLSNCIRCDYDQVCSLCSGSFDSVNGTCVRYTQPQSNQNQANFVGSKSSGLSNQMIIGIICLALIDVLMILGIIVVSVLFCGKDTSEQLINQEQLSKIDQSFQMNEKLNLSRKKRKKALGMVQTLEQLTVQYNLDQRYSFLLFNFLNNILMIILQQQFQIDDTNNQL